MTLQTREKRTLGVWLLIAAALLVLFAVYHTPIWWVALKAPNYPPEAFPDGVRIHFHMNGVFNGCKLVEKAEIQEEEALDCVHEMDTINHYVGMYPIASGGPVERGFSQFLVAFVAVMLFGVACTQPRLRMLLMTVGFAAVAAWMLTTLYTDGGVLLQSDGYQQSLQRALDLDPEEIQDWSGYHAIVEGYQDSLGMYFRDAAEIMPRVEFLKTIVHVVAAVLILLMLVLIVAARKNGLFYWLLVLVPILLPLLFLVDYSAWLWWYGHNLNPMGAFTVKPFMPTVFGDGKVAQFSTHSYPYWGFGLMIVFSMLLAIAALLRRKQLREG